MDRNKRNRDIKTRYRDRENRGNRDRDLGNRENRGKPVFANGRGLEKHFFGEKYFFGGTQDKPPKPTNRYKNLKNRDMNRKNRKDFLLDTRLLVGY